jgi:hypothetical protein
MKRNLLLVLVAVVAVAGLWLYQNYAPRHAPAGQPTLVSLNADTFDQFVRSFNAASDQVRVLVMLSPT